MLRPYKDGLFILAVAACAGLGTPRAHAGQIYLNGLTVGSGNATVSVKSFQERKFSTTIKQEYDFSCGSAALATLLTFSYQKPVVESDVFASMFLNGNQLEIRQYGFSLLDMKEYLARQGLPSGGFKAPLSKLAEVRVPAIVLINENGYRHFVVIRGIEDHKVLLADPALGLRAESIPEFQKQWSGIFFIVLADVPTAQANFNSADDWSAQPDAPLALSRFAVDLITLQQVTIPLSTRF
jgi:predicted double-glycine peptidase